MDGFREDGADAVPEAIEVSHADVLRKLIVTAEEIHQYIQVKLGGEERSVTRSGYRLSIVTVKKGVSWAKEFATAMGEAAAEKLRKNAGEREKLTVEKI